MSTNPPFPVVPEDPDADPNPDLPVQEVDGDEQLDPDADDTLIESAEADRLAADEG